MKSTIVLLRKVINVCLAIFVLVGLNAWAGISVLPTPIQSDESNKTENTSENDNSFKSDNDEIKGNKTTRNKANIIKTNKSESGKLNTINGMGLYNNSNTNEHNNSSKVINESNSKKKFHLKKNKDPILSAKKFINELKGKSTKKAKIETVTSIQKKALFEINKVQKSKAPLIQTSKSKKNILSLQKEDISSVSSKIEQNGVFAVKDPTLKIVEREWKYVLGLKAQSFKPRGKVHSPIVGDFNLNKYESHLLPSIEFGILKKYENLVPWNLWTAFLQIGYNSVKVPVVFQSGYQAPENTRLKILKLDVNLESQSLLYEAAQSVYYKAGAAFGKLYYTQTSLNDFAQFSESVFFGSILLGVTYQSLTNLEWMMSYVYRQTLGVSSLDLQAHNLELGMRLQW